MSYKFRTGELKKFWGWINERHSIYLKKEAKAPWPWTANKVLQDFKFTNPFRQNDRVTQEWVKRYAHLLAKKYKDEDIFFYLCMFRFFNWPPTYDALFYGLGKKWNLKKAVEILHKRKTEDFEQLFTGAYIITAAGKEEPKHEVICEALDSVYQQRKKMLGRIQKGRSMQKATEILTEINTVGPFIAYEIVCDMRHTKLLHDALDVNTWANAGPGAKRGIHRLLFGDKEKPKSKDKPDYNVSMHELWKMHKERCSKDVLKADWPFEMREIEHSLCEYDKMRRVENGEGRPRSRYRYKDPADLPWSDDDE